MLMDLWRIFLKLKTSLKLLLQMLVSILLLWVRMIKLLRILCLSLVIILKRVSLLLRIKSLMELSSKNSFLQSRFKPLKILISKLISRNILNLPRLSLTKKVLDSNKSLKISINNTNQSLLNSDVNSPIVNSLLDLFSLLRRKKALYGKILKINKFFLILLRVVQLESFSLIQLSEMPLDSCLSSIDKTMLCLRSKEWRNYSLSVWLIKKEESSSLPLCCKTKVVFLWALFLKVLKSKDRLRCKSVRFSKWTRLIFLEVLSSLIKTKERLRDSTERTLFRSEISILKMMPD